MRLSTKALQLVSLLVVEAVLEVAILSHLFPTFDSLQSKVKIMETEVKYLQVENRRLKEELQQYQHQLNQLQAKTKVVNSEKFITLLIASLIPSYVPEIRRLKIAEAVFQASEEYGVPVAILLAVIEQESHFNPYAKSKAGCVGLMQINPRVWKIKRPYDIRENILVGAKILRRYYDRTKSWKKALMRYYGESGDGFHIRYAKSVLSKSLKYRI